MVPTLLPAAVFAWLYSRGQLPLSTTSGLEFTLTVCLGRSGVSAVCNAPGSWQTTSTTECALVRSMNIRWLSGIRNPAAGHRSANTYPEPNKQKCLDHSQGAKRATHVLLTNHNHVTTPPAIGKSCCVCESRTSKLGGGRWEVCFWRVSLPREFILVMSLFNPASARVVPENMTPV